MPKARRKKPSRRRPSAAPESTTRSYEKLGLFYLGRPYDLASGTTKPGLTLYDSKDLTTHAVCVGMTGSGKTGLCVGLIEEAAIDGIPVIAIDPKGDLGNLMLTFPKLSARDFRPWVNMDEAERQGMTADEYASDRAAQWRSGLADWHQDADRIRRLRESADFAVYTPGSTAGLPISILSSFAAPPEALREDPELLAERINTTATSLLTLAGIDAEPVRSREHVLVATILSSVWGDGRDVDLGSLIQHIQPPPVKRIGVLDLDAFYPAKERFELAMRINQLLAAPGFELWLKGEPLDVSRLLYTEEGKPRVSIISIAHLGDAERMSFVSLLLNQVLGWMRSQPGTNSLRAMLYMDEIFGYFPPVANPPSKAPLLTLLKQARAYGLGVVLATQNPVDLDYKGLSNTGTWFLGRLQTERDKARVLDGLEGVASGSGSRFDRGAMEETLAGLSSRVFLMHNVHEDAPEVFQTRWVMSYLRGPLTREQIRTLMKDRKAQAIKPSASVEASPPATEPEAPTPARSRPAGPSPTDEAKASSPPILSPDIPQYFLPITEDRQNASYAPALYGAATLEFSDRRLRVSETRDAAFVVRIRGGAAPVNWKTATPTDCTPEELGSQPDETLEFGDLPTAATKVKSYAKWERAFKSWLVRSQTIELLECRDLKMVSQPNESERDFRIRLRDRAHEERDEAVTKLRKRYATKIRTLTERVRRSEQAVEREAKQASQQKLQTTLSFGAAVLSAMLGRKATTRSTLGRATTAARGVGRSMKEQQDITRAKDTVGALKAQLSDLEGELLRSIDELELEFDPLTVELDPAVVKTSSRKVSSRLVALVWST